MIISGKQFFEIQQATIDMLMEKSIKSTDRQIWEIIKTKFRACPNCDTFDPSECARCYDYKNYVLDQSPSSEESHDYLRKLKYMFSIDDLYSFEDYEKE